MESYLVYVAKTFMVAITKIGPIVGFVVIGYFIFIKLPFLLFRNSLRSNRPYEFTPEASPQPEYKSDYSVNDYNDFLRRQGRLGSNAEEPKKEEPKKEEKTEQKAKEERKKEEKKAPPRKERPKDGASPEEKLFKFSAGQRFTKDELKKRYRKLLMENHPDKMASEGTQIRSIAEVRTKEINSAYDKLKVRAA